MTLTLTTRPVPEKDPAAQPYRLGISSTDLKRFPAESEVILRIGAICNGVQTMSRSMRRIGFPAAVDAPRTDDLYYMVIVSAWMKELSVILHQRHDGLAWKMLERGVALGRVLPENITLDELRTLTTRDSAFRSGCETIREKFAFHMDPEPFRRWLDLALPDQMIAVFTSTTGWLPDVYIDFAVFAMRRFIDDLGSDLFRDISRVGGALPNIIEAMLRGFSDLRGVRVILTEVPASLQRSL